MVQIVSPSSTRGRIKVKDYQQHSTDRLSYLGDRIGRGGDVITGLQSQGIRINYDG
jgi:hypothetical protein